MYALGGITALIVIAGTVLDILLGTILSGVLLIVYLILVTYAAALQAGVLPSMFLTSDTTVSEPSISFITLLTASKE